jgi:RimJ/RimL family protein N-acetyltransferase
VGIATPPYRIETDRLVIRCYELEDAPLLKEAVDSSIDHLLPWMPWARLEPQTLDEKVELLRGFRSSFDADEEYPYGVFEPDESRQLGGTGLHRRGGEGSLEIGYFLRADATGRGLATEMTAVLARAAVEKCGVDRVDIQVDPANKRSLLVPRRLGFVEEATLRRRLEPKEYGGPRRDTILFTLLAEELPISACVAYEYRAFDALGRGL